MERSFRGGWRYFWRSYEFPPIAFLGFFVAFVVLDVLCDLFVALVKAIWRVL